MRNYQREYRRRLELELQRSQRTGIPFSIARARGHPRREELSATAVKKLPDKEVAGRLQPNESIQDLADRLSVTYRGLRRDQIPREVVDGLKDMGYTDEEVWELIYGASP